MASTRTPALREASVTFLKTLVAIHLEYRDVDRDSNMFSLWDIPRGL